MSCVSGVLYAGSATHSKLSVEAYIFQQYAARQNKSLADVLPEVIPMARDAGFRNIELNAEFLADPIGSETLGLIRSSSLQMPSVYSGGVMHEPQRAAETVRKVLRIGQLCKPFGCEAVVFNADPKGQGIEKTDEELASQAAALNRLGQVLRENQLQLRLHNHTPEMIRGAREWHFNLKHTDPKYVAFCLDLDWVHQSDQNPLGLLREAGSRVSEIHVRNSRGKLWLESFGEGDVNFPEIARYLRMKAMMPLIVVELAYRQETEVTRPLVEDLRLSRMYAEEVFGIRA